MLLEVKNLSIEYSTIEGRGYAVERACFNLAQGQIVGLVGESGSGKSTLGWSIIRLLPDSAKVRSGNIFFRGQDVLSLSEKKLNETIRGKEISVIVQDPQNSLNPVFSIRTQLNDIIAISGKKSFFRKTTRIRQPSFLEFFRSINPQRKTEAVRLLADVGIADAAKRMDEYPHSFSGGMKQRIMMVMAFIVNPSLLIADEPTTALDVTVEVQIIEQLKQLIERYGTAVLYITHDLGIISEIADRVMVMYAGNIVEIADKRDLFTNPLHPYTKALLKCMPSGITRNHQLETIPGNVPSIFNFPSGCRFHPRCVHAQQICKEMRPVLESIPDSAHEVSCFVAQTAAGLARK